MANHRELFSEKFLPDKLQPSCSAKRTLGWISLYTYLNFLLIDIKQRVSLNLESSNFWNIKWLETPKRLEKTITMVQIGVFGPFIKLEREHFGIVGVKFCSLYGRSTVTRFFYQESKIFVFNFWIQRTEPLFLILQIKNRTK